ncbi:MAG: class F sortase [Chloroflexi bacterium]|nr:class F sortase [Chloroflexota bacterium]
MTSRGLLRGSLRMMARAVSHAIDWSCRNGRTLGVGCAVIAAGALAACSGGDSGVKVTPATATATATATVAATAQEKSPPSIPTPKVTPGPDPGRQPFRNLDDFLKEYDYPKDANFARIKIPAISVDARVASRTVGGDGIMPDPAGPADVVWYDLSGWPGLGGRPGEGGNAVFSGHVDYDYLIPYAGVPYRGQGVFSKISALSSGDLVEIEYGGKTLRYQVVSRKQYHVGGGTDWAAVWSSKVSKDTITLYTCGGPFDTITKEYSDRVVVRAERVG